MSTRRTRHKTYAFDCDGCGTAIDTECFDFGKAVDVMKAQGWRAVREGEQWQHYCEDC